MNKKLLSPLIGVTCVAMAATSASALTITPTTDTTALATALGGGGGLTITSVAINNGAASQFGTYTGFTSPPVTIGPGVVLSTGPVTETTAAFHSSVDSPSTDLGQPGTTEFNNYGPGHITNFGGGGDSPGSNDVAALQVNFTLSSASQVGFDFIFGSVEYPVYTNNYTDAFLAFLDGTAPANQIVFDANGNAVQVGETFAGALTTADTNTAFSDPHGLVKLQTFTNMLTAGPHSIIFEVGDVNDHFLDSAVFISDIHAGEGTPGTNPENPTVPEPASLALFGIGLAGLAKARRHKHTS